MQLTSAEYNVSVRGNNQVVANKLLVMIDGRSIYEDAYGSVFWTTLPVTLPEIKRIEVLKGPAASIYGFNAFDGVINIITKPPEELKGSLVQFGGGELGTIRASAIHAGNHKKFGYRLSVGHDQNQQWQNRDALALRQTKFNLHTQYTLPAESMVSLQGGFLSNNRYDGQTFGTIAETTTGITSGYVNAMYKRPNFFIGGWWTYWRHENEETINPLISPFLQIFDKAGDSSQERERNTYNLDIQHDVEFGSFHHFTYGMNLRTTIFTSNFLTSDKTHEDRVGLYMQEAWQPNKKFTVSAGIRFDLHSQINPTYSPRLVLVYKPSPDHAIRISGSLGYRPPTLFETFIDASSTICLGAPCPGGFVLSRNLVGNKNLKPEQIISYEIEYQGWYLKHRLRFRFAFFYNQISDLITFNVPTPINQTQKADIFGGEAGTEFFATPWLSGFINMSYVQIGQDFMGTTRRGAPRFKYNGGLRVDLENGLNGETSLYYVGSAQYPIEEFFSIAQGFAGGQPAPDERIGSFFLLNFRVAYKFWKERAEVAVTAFNALNDKHKEHPLGDVIGSQVLGWLTLKY